MNNDIECYVYPRYFILLPPSSDIKENLFFRFTVIVKEIMGQCMGRGSDDPFNDIHPHIFSVLNIDENGR